jgi:hypothetical protein
MVEIALIRGWPSAPTRARASRAREANGLPSSQIRGSESNKVHKVHATIARGPSRRRAATRGDRKLGSVHPAF